MKIILFSIALIAVGMAFAESLIMQNGSKVWRDRAYTLDGLPESIQFKNPVPDQACGGYKIVLPEGCRKALIAINDSQGGAEVAAKHNGVGHNERGLPLRTVHF